MPPKDRADHLDSARKLYVDFLATGDHPLVPLARLNLAKTMEDSGNFEGANAAFMEAERSGREGPLTFVASEAIWGQARCASHLGRPEQALNLVNSAVDRVGASSRPRWYQAACAFRDTLRKVDPKDDLRLKKDVVSDSPDTPAAPQIPEAPPPAPVTGDDAGTRG
jgi:tetratricopeptide (TPR) repeat protein